MIIKLTIYYIVMFKTNTLQNSRSKPVAMINGLFKRWGPDLKKKPYEQLYNIRITFKKKKTRPKGVGAIASSSQSLVSVTVLNCNRIK